MKLLNGVYKLYVQNITNKIILNFSHFKFTCVFISLFNSFACMYLKKAERIKNL